MTILLSAYVDKGSAAELNLGSPTLECTLILHTALGKDYFLPVSGHYRTSSHNVFPSILPFISDHDHEWKKRVLTNALYPCRVHVFREHARATYTIGRADQEAQVA